MDSVSVDITYGKALFDAAEDLKKTETLNVDLKDLVEIIRKNPVFFDMLKSPAISNDEKKTVVDNVFKGKMDETLLNFLYVLIDKRRINQFLSIARAFEKCVDEKKGVTAGTIFSAVDIPKDKLEKFEKETGALLKKNVALKNEIDPGLIGGIKIYVDGKLIDASIRRRLDDLKEHLL